MTQISLSITGEVIGLETLAWIQLQRYRVERVMEDVNNHNLIIRIKGTYINIRREEMKRSSFLTMTLGLVFLLAISSATQAQNWQRIPGEIGASPRFKSGWLDLAPAIDFMKDDQLRLSIGGTASKILIRLLPDAESPGDPVGIIGHYTVPTNRIVEITLNEDHQNIIQISVHGGPNPWGLFPLGGGNGPATLLSVYRATQ